MSECDGTGCIWVVGQDLPDACEGCAACETGAWYLCQLCGSDTQYGCWECNT